MTDKFDVGVMEVEDGQRIVGKSSHRTGHRGRLYHNSDPTYKLWLQFVEILCMTK